jgi:predicted lipoprotein with Yx(FWY)xxD motif
MTPQAYGHERWRPPVRGRKYLDKNFTRSVGEPMSKKWWAAAGLAAATTMLVAACGSSSPGSGSGSGSSLAAASGRGIKTASTSIGKVLTNSAGFTLYWFAIDTKTASKCYGTCASFWPPVIGKATAASGVSLPGMFGTIKRKNGQLQATYDGHPLYTYKGDTSPGQTKGNGLNISGGLWHAVSPTGAMLANKPKPKASQSSSGGGYGY